MIPAKGETSPPVVCGPESWMPFPAHILDIRDENINTYTIRLRIEDDNARNAYRWAPGQFNILYVPGVGEAAISISSDPEDPAELEHTIRVVGSVTSAIKKRGTGGLIGLRGPFGTSWPTEGIKKNSVVMVAGGIGLAPIRPLIYWLLHHRNHCKRVVLLYGCRSPEDRVFARELEEWELNSDLDVLVTVDNATGNWTGPVGVVTQLLRRVRIDAGHTTVMVCGPKILNRVASWKFLQLHVRPEHLYVSLERNMNCGFGQCGHCQYGSKFVCRDGPVFRFDEISHIFAKEEI